MATYADEPSRPASLRAQDLVGAWRLKSIRISGPEGDVPDPFFGEGCSGLMIYDASGWFSVQIMGAGRHAVGVPTRREPGSATLAAAAERAAAFDSYYAYFGTWSFDPTTSVVTHHSLGAVYPDETGATYAQRVDITGGRMTYTRRDGEPGREHVQTKIWERVTPP